MSTSDGSRPPARPQVTALVVTHDGERWLGDVVAGLRQQTRPADRVLAVDTGSRDSSRQIFGDAFGADAVVTADPEVGFGAAVAAGLAASGRVPKTEAPSEDPPPADAGTVEWVWLLHDDSAPSPAALPTLLEFAEANPSAGVVGPKLRAWPQGRRLLEVGITITGSGSRETGLEHAEFDQGQHDDTREVLAVSTAGMLVRRDVFDQLGGLDPDLPLFRDDVDFGWRVTRAGHQVMVCPDAIVFHAEAGWRGARELPAVHGRARRVDRKHAIHTLLVNCAGWALPLVALRLVSGSLLRAMALLVVKWPDAAYDEAAAMVGAIRRPLAIARGRRRRRRTGAVRPRAVRPLLPPPWIGLQHAAEALGGVISARSGTHAGSGRRSRRPSETGPVPEEAEELDEPSGGAMRWFFTRPAVVLVLVLLVAALVAGRELLGGGVLQGGGLAPAPGGAWDLWRRYLESWHPVDLGGASAAPPYLAVVAGLSTVLLGKTWLAIDVLILGSVPLAGLTAYVASGRVARARSVRVWVGVLYGLLPATTGAIAAGRLGTCVAIVALPLVVVAACRAFGVRRAGSAAGSSLPAGSWPATFATGLLLTLAAVFVPVAWVAAGVLGVALLVSARWLRRSVPVVAGRIAVILAVPVVLALPWVLRVWVNPRLLLGEAGVPAPGLADSDLPAYLLALGDPGGSGSAPVWLFAALGLAALAGLLRRDRGTGVLAAWAVAFTGLVVGLVQIRFVLRMPWLEGSVTAWPGLASVLIVAGFLGAAAHGGDGIVRHFTERSFSWRQPVAGLLALVVAVTPLVAVGWWVARGAGTPVERSVPTSLPPYVVDAERSGTHPRAVVLHPDRDGGVTYTLQRGSGQRLGDAETGSSVAELDRLDSVVSQLLTRGSAAEAVDRLASFGIGYVYLPDPAGRRITELLDTIPGVSRASAPRGAAIWALDRPVGRMWIDPPGRSAEPAVLRTGAIGADVDVAAGPAGRRLVVAEAFDSGWTVTVDGEPVRAHRYDGWAQAYRLPASGGQVRVTHDGSGRAGWLAFEGLALLVALGLAVPGRRRGEPAEFGGEPGRRAGEMPIRPRHAELVGGMAPAAGPRTREEVTS